MTMSVHIKHEGPAHYTTKVRVFHRGVNGEPDREATAENFELKMGESRTVTVWKEKYLIVEEGA